MEYLITGVTGLVGSHILFELLAEKFSANSPIKIYALVRASDKAVAISRIRKILNSDILPDYLKPYATEMLLQAIHPIALDLISPELETTLQQTLPKTTIVIHSAASTNLMPGKSAAKDVFTNNHQGTIRLLDATRHCKKFVYISTAFSCGIQKEPVTDDYSYYQNANYRNAYEENKALIENHIRLLAAKQPNRLFQILRPAVVCGRLGDTPHYVTTKFDVFYGMAKFAWAYKDLINQLGLRMHINTHATLNIIPVDYTAKAIICASKKDEISELNIAHATPPKHQEYISIMLKTLGIDNFSYIGHIPKDLNRIEKIYYKTLVKVLGPYVMTPRAIMDVSNLQKIFPINQPDICQHMQGLIQYAANRKFEDGFPGIRLAAAT